MLIYITPPLVTYVIPILEADTFALFGPGEQPEVHLLGIVLNSSPSRAQAPAGPVREASVRSGRGRPLEGELRGRQGARGHLVPVPGRVEAPFRPLSDHVSVSSDCKEGAMCPPVRFL